MNFLRGIRSAMQPSSNEEFSTIEQRRPTNSFVANRSSAATEYHDRVQNVSLTYLRIQQFLHLTDRHIPLAIIRLYYEELNRPLATRNKTAITVYTVLLRDWHMMRNKLNFVRDMTKLALMLGRRLNENVIVIEAALKNTEITQQEVYQSIMSDLHEEARQSGRAFDEFILYKYDQMGVACDETSSTRVNSLQALFPDATIGPRTFWNSFTMNFLLRLFKETFRSAVKLDGDNGDFFGVSEPSWSCGGANRFNDVPRTAREIAEENDLRKKLMDRLLHGDATETTAAETIEETTTAKKGRFDEQMDEADDQCSISTKMFREVCENNVSETFAALPPPPPPPPPSPPTASSSLSPSLLTTTTTTTTIDRLEENSKQLAATMNQLRETTLPNSEQKIANVIELPGDDIDDNEDEEEEEDDEEEETKEKDDDYDDNSVVDDDDDDDDADDDDADFL